MARKVRDWFIERSIYLFLNWPLYSLDLNFIEYVWWHLKCRVCEIFPNVVADKSELEYSRQRLESCI